MRTARRPHQDLPALQERLRPRLNSQNRRRVAAAERPAVRTGKRRDHLNCAREFSTLTSSAKPLKLQIQRLCRLRERVVRSSDSSRVDRERNRQVEGVEGSQRDRPKPDQEITSIERMPIFQRMDLKKAAPDIILQSRGRAAFHAGIKLAVATTACEKAAKFEHGQPAN